MNNRYVILFLVGLWIPITNVKAQVVVLESVDDAIEYALENNSSLEAYKLQVQITNYNYKIQKNSKMPTISYSFSSQNNTEQAVTPVPGELFGQPGETVEAQFGQPYAFNSGITIQSDKLDWRNRFQTKLAENEKDILNAEVSEYEQNLVQQVSLYYYTALIAKEAISINQESIAISDSIVGLTELRFEEGLEDQFSLNQSKMNASNSWRTLLSNQGLYDECVSQLKNLFGIDVEDELQFNEVIAYEPPSDLPANGMTSNRRLHTLSRQIESSELNVKLQKAAFVPSLSMTTYNGKQLNKDKFRLDIGKGTWADYSYVAATLSIPIFSGFNRTNQVKIANRELSLAKLNYETELRNSELADMLLLSDYQHGIQTVDKSQSTYTLAKENEGIAYVRYEEGLITLDQYLNAVEDRLQSENAYLNDLSLLYTHYSTLISRSEYQ